jgi:hypothetical protein
MKHTITSMGKLIWLWCKLVVISFLSKLPESALSLFFKPLKSLLNESVKLIKLVKDHRIIFLLFLSILGLVVSLSFMAWYESKNKEAEPWGKPILYYWESVFIAKGNESKADSGTANANGESVVGAFELLVSGLAAYLAFKAWRTQQEEIISTKRLDVVQSLNDDFILSDMFDALEYFKTLNKDHDYSELVHHVLEIKDSEKLKTLKDYIKKKHPKDGKNWEQTFQKHRFRVMESLHTAEFLYRSKDLDIDLLASVITPNIVEVVLYSIGGVDSIQSAYDMKVYKFVYDVFESIRADYIAPYFYTLINRNNFDDEKIRQARHLLEALRHWSRLFGNQDQNSYSTYNSDLLMTEVQLLLLDWVDEKTLYAEEDLEADSDGKLDENIKKWSGELNSKATMAERKVLNDTEIKIKPVVETIYDPSQETKNLDEILALELDPEDWQKWLSLRFVEEAWRLRMQELFKRLKVDELSEKEKEKLSKTISKLYLVQGLSIEKEGLFFQRLEGRGNTDAIRNVADFFFKEAQKSFEAALEYNPKSPEANYKLGNFHFHQEYGFEIETSPPELKLAALLKLVALQVSLIRFKKALDLDKYQQYDDAKHKWGLTLFKNNQVDKALDHLDSKDLLRHATQYLEKATETREAETPQNKTPFRKSYETRIWEIENKELSARYFQKAVKVHLVRYVIYKEKAAKAEVAEDYMKQADKERNKATKILEDLSPEHKDSFSEQKTKDLLKSGLNLTKEELESVFPKSPANTKVQDTSSSLFKKSWELLKRFLKLK